MSITHRREWSFYIKYKCIHFFRYFIRHVLTDFSAPATWLFSASPNKPWLILKEKKKQNNFLTGIWLQRNWWQIKRSNSCTFQSCLDCSRVRSMSGTLPRESCWSHLPPLTCSLAQLISHNLCFVANDAKIYIKLFFKYF